MKALANHSGSIQKTLRTAMTSLGFLASAILSQGAFAGHNYIDQIIDQPEIILAGSGCSLQNDNLSVLQNNRAAVIAIGFSQMSLIGSSRKSCVLRFPIEIPAGFKLVVSGGEANGYTDLSSGDSLAIGSYISVTGANSSVLTKRINGPTYEDFGPSVSDPFGDIFRSRRTVISTCAHRALDGFISLNLAASQLSSSRHGYSEITDVALGVRLVPCH